MQRNPAVHLAAGICLLSILWAAELFFIQESTYSLEYLRPDRSQQASRIIRFGLNVLFAGTLVALLRRRELYPLFALQAVAALGLLVYADAFGRALSFQTIRHQAAEGQAVFGVALDLVQGSDAATLAGLFAAKLAIREWWAYRFRWRARSKRLALCLLGTYLGGLVTLTAVVDPLSKLRTYATVDRVGQTYGYLVAWTADWVYNQPGTLLSRAEQRAKDTRDRLSPVETDLDFGDRVVIIQVESLGYDTFTRRIDGAFVTPFLQALSTRSLLYRVRAEHVNGSADADFVMLMCRLPSRDVVNYFIKGYTFVDALPRLAGRNGYHSYALHGATGTFYNRRHAYEQMGFHQLFFREELRAHYTVRRGLLGPMDRDVFDFSRRLLARPGREKQLHFIITLTSHGPFYVPPAERELFPTPASVVQEYLNTLRYTDSALRDYVSGLPDGTTVILYGDHESQVLHDPEDGPEYVPFLIHHVGADWSRLQRTRRLRIAQSGELHLLDLATYVRRQLDHQESLAAPAPHLTSGPPP